MTSIDSNKDVTMKDQEEAQDCAGRYKMVVSGKTFGAHQEFLDKLKAQVELTESSDNQKINILFCVISSRVGSDVEAAMAEVKDDKPVILVLMHHLREPTATTSVRTWAQDDKYDNIVFHDHVFYHETVKGLVKCKENDEAVSRIQNKLVEFFPRRKGHAKGQRNQAVRAESRHYEDVTMKDQEEAQDCTGATAGASHVLSQDQSDGRRQGAQKRSYADSPGSSAPRLTGGQSERQQDVTMKDQEEAQDCTGRYKMVVSGKTFGAHQEFLDKLKAQVELTESSDNQKITILFCVISSRVGSDVEAAMAEVKDDKPVILVLMHHLREPTATTSVRTWAQDDKYDNIVFHDHVFYHETVKGLVKCKENDEAVSRIQNKLVEFFPRRKGHAKGQRNQAVDAESRHYEDVTMKDQEEAQDCTGATAGASHVLSQDQSDGRRQGAQKQSYADSPGSSAPRLTGGQSERQQDVTMKDQEEAQDCTGRYKMVVSGKTFGAHQEFLDKLKAQVELTESSDNQKINILFCVISSRVGSDVEAAMAEVKDDKPVILVLMHHLREPTATTSVRTWAQDDKYDNIVFHDHVFYHETVKGLVKCKENDEAVSRIQNKLVEFFPRRKGHAKGQRNQAVRAESRHYEDVTMKDQEEAQDCTGRYKMVVSGKTFGAHQEFLDKLKAQVELTESSDNQKINILFCVISSRVGSDVEAAMAEVKDDKPVILVLMHHLREPTATTSVRTWAQDDKYDNIVFHDHVFYHETVKGLVKCKENDEAVSRIQNKLVEFFPRRKGHAKGQRNQAVDAESRHYEDITMKDQEEAQDCTGRYKMVVSGKTFGAHQEFLDKLKAQVELTESSDNQKINILFCVISSRVGSDVEAAMAEVKDDKPVILVLMHHLREPTATTSVRTWAQDDKYDNIVFHDHVFYHETVKGLVKCKENDEAVSRIQNKLVEFFPRRKGHAKGQRNQPVDAERGKGGSKSGKDDKDKGSGKNSGSSWLSKWFKK